MNKTFLNIFIVISCLVVLFVLNKIVINFFGVNSAIFEIYSKSIEYTFIYSLIICVMYFFIIKYNEITSKINKDLEINNKLIGKNRKFFLNFFTIFYYFYFVVINNDVSLNSIFALFMFSTYIVFFKTNYNIFYFNCFLYLIFLLLRVTNISLT